MFQLEYILSKNKLAVSVLCILVLMSVSLPSIVMGLSQAKVDEIIATIEDKQENSGDYTAISYIQFSEKGHDDVLYQSVVYRRDQDDAFMILFTEPKEEAGKCYLMMDDNLLFYDPVTGYWERRTVRENIVGTGSRQADMDDPDYTEEYQATFVADETLGAFKVHHLRLTAKTEVDVAYPIVELWVDQATLNVLKVQDFALSGRLMRTSYYTKWNRIYSQSKGEYVWYPGEMRIYDEVETDNSTIIVIKKVDLKSLPSNIFTKAWVEAQSR